MNFKKFAKLLHNMNLFEQQSMEFHGRHIGIDENDKQKMLESCGLPSIGELISRTIPADIRTNTIEGLPDPVSEYEYLSELRNVASKNKVFKSYIGQGYYGTITPSVILRNVFENPGWYTQYTPYQVEISQGRLESLLNFQTVVAELTALPLTNASLLDEATAAAEAMNMIYNVVSKGKPERIKFFVDKNIFPQTYEVLVTRATPIGIEIVNGNYKEAELDETYFGAIVQYPNSEGSVE